MNYYLKEHDILFRGPTDPPTGVERFNWITKRWQPAGLAQWNRSLVRLSRTEAAEVLRRWGDGITDPERYL